MKNELEVFRGMKKLNNGVSVEEVETDSVRLKTQKGKVISIYISPEYPLDKWDKFTELKQKTKSLDISLGEFIKIISDNISEVNLIFNSELVDKSFVSVNTVTGSQKLKVGSTTVEELEGKLGIGMLNDDTGLVELYAIAIIAMIIGERIKKIKFNL